MRCFPSYIQIQVVPLNDLHQNSIKLYCCFQATLFHHPFHCRVDHAHQHRSHLLPIQAKLVTVTLSLTSDPPTGREQYLLIMHWMNTLKSEACWWLRQLYPALRAAYKRSVSKSCRNNGDEGCSLLRSGPYYSIPPLNTDVGHGPTRHLLDIMSQHLQAALAAAATVHDPIQTS